MSQEERGESMKSIFFGNLFTCELCKRFMANIEGQDYTFDEYKEISEKWEIVFKKRGNKLLSMVYDSLLCKKCELMRDAEVELKSYSV